MTINFDVGLERGYDLFQILVRVEIVTEEQAVFIGVAGVIKKDFEALATGCSRRQLRSQVR